MRVAIDGTPLLGSRTGVGEVTHGIVNHLAARSDVDLVVYAVTFSGRRELASVIPAEARAAVRPVPARAVRALWARTAHPRIERWTGPVDVVHATNFVGPPAGAPVLVTIHDLTFLRYPELCTPDTLRYPQSIRRALDRGAHIHVPSDFVRTEVQEAFGLEAERVTRIYSGLSASPAQASAGQALPGSRRYVLALGTIEPRKNFPALVAAFDHVAATDPDLELVIVGPDGWGADALARAGAVPEVVGEAAELVEPDDVDALAGARGRVLTDDARRAELVARGTERIRRYSWTTTASELVALYEHIR